MKKFREQSGGFSPSFIFITAVSLFMVGIILASLNFALVMIVVPAVAVFYLLFIKPKLVVLFALSLLFGFSAYFIKEESFNRKVNIVAKQKEFTVEVSELVDDRGSYRLITGFVDSPRVKILVKTFERISVEPGMSIIVSGNLIRPDDDGIFSYANYLKSHGYAGQVETNEVRLTGRKNNSPIYPLMKTRERLVLKINELLPEPESSLLAGLLVGSKSGLRGEILESFNRTGTTHIVAVSGFNVTILALFFLAVFKRKSWAGLSAVVLAISLFALLAGLTASVVRASLMGITLLVGKNIIGRRAHLGAILFLAAGVMAVLNPFVVVYDLSFLLSFSATAGLIFAAPLIATSLPLGKKLQEPISQIMAAQLFTIPFTLLAFQQLSLVALFANLIIVPLIPLTMLFGFLLLSVSLFSQFVASIVAYPVYLLLNAILKIASSFSSLDFAQLEYSPPVFIPISLFTILAILIFRPLIREELVVAQD